jgi:hypothetical protein
MAPEGMRRPPATRIHGELRSGKVREFVIALFAGLVAAGFVTAALSLFAAAVH